MTKKPIGGAVLATVLLAVACAWLSPASRAADKPASKAEPKIITNAIGMKLAPIPAGKFTMGSPASEKDRDNDEGPQHEVEITKPFHMGVHEVTQEEYEKVMRTNPSRFKGSKNPVETVSWNNATEFCRKLSNLPEEKRAGRTYRLPTEAEWEYACRGGSSKAYCFGNDAEQLQEYAWYSNNSGNKTHPVGMRNANAFGLHDMHGNVWEWCADWYDEGYYKDSPRQDPENTKEDSARVLRGGGWVSDGRSCRSADRYWYPPDHWTMGLGFRVAAVQSLVPKLPPETKVEPRPETGTGKTIANALGISFDSVGDPLPAGVLARLGTVRMRHESHVGAVAFFPDGKTIASASWDHTVRLWDVATGKEIRRLTGHSDYIYSMALSPDGKTLATGSKDQTIRIWETASGKELRQCGSSSLALTVAFAPDGKTLASGNVDKTIHIWELATGRELQRWQEHGDMVWSVVFSPDGKTLASTGRHETICLWEATSGKIIRRWKGHPFWNKAVAFSPDGKTLLSASGDKTIRLWEVATGQEIRRLTGHRNHITDVAFSPDGRMIASASWDRTIRLWEAATGTEKHQIKCGLWPVESLKFSADGKYLVSGSAHHVVQLWEADTGKELNVLPGHQGPAYAVAFFPDGKTLATGGMDGTIRLWDRATSKEIGRLLGHRNTVDSVAVSPDSKLLASGSYDETIRLWDANTGKEMHTIKEHLSPVKHVSFSPDGKRLVSAHQNEMVYLWEAATGKVLRSWRRATRGGVDTAVFSPDGKIVVAPGDVGQIHLWDAVTGKALPTLEGSVWSRGVAISPDGTVVASADMDKSIRLWKLPGRRQLHCLEGHLNEVFQVAFSPDGKLLATGSKPHSITGMAKEERSLRLWEVATGTEIRHWAGHGQAVLGMGFSPDGRTLACAGEDTTVLLWDVADWCRGGREPRTDLSRKDLQTLWDDLAHENANRAYRALWTLAGVPQKSVSFLAKRIQPVPPVDPKGLDRLVADLDSDRFAVRSKAAEDLKNWAEIAEPFLLKKLQGKPSLETARRIEELLEKVKEKELAPDWLRKLRALQVLELAGTAEARRLLQSLASGATEAWLTQEARKSRERLLKGSMDKP